MKKSIIALSLFVALVTPSIAFAQLTNVLGLVATSQAIVNLAIPIVFAIALLAFFWGLAKFINNSGSEEKKAEGKNLMIWGVLALFIMASIWGIVIFIGDALGVGQGGATPTPAILNSSSGAIAPE